MTDCSAMRRAVRLSRRVETFFRGKVHINELATRKVVPDVSIYAAANVASLQN